MKSEILKVNVTAWMFLNVLAELGEAEVKSANVFENQKKRREKLRLIT
jgi:hypothetical protein